MGDVGSAIATPFVAVGAVVTGQASKKIYYNCPRCGKERWVWASGAAFAGRKCLDCRGNSGPLDLGIVGDAIDVAATPFTATGAILTGNANEKIYYNCPKCGGRKWVSAMAPHLAGRVCLKCKPAGNRTIESIHPMGSLASINKIEQDCATLRGTVIYQQWGSRIDVDKSYLIDKSDKILSYDAKACRIFHGSISWAYNGIAQVLTLGDAPYMDHTWTVIKTEKGYYYQLQFRSNGKTDNPDGLIELRKCSSWYDSNQTGLAEAGQQPDADIFEFSGSSYSYSDPTYTMGQVIAWMKSHAFSAHYKLYSHNCQNLCKKFYDEF